MHYYSLISATALAVIASSPARAEYFDSISSPTRDQIVEAGKAFVISWVPLDVDTTISITLLQGATNVTLQPASILKSGIKNQDASYTWNVPTSEGSFATYGFLITDEQNSTRTEYSQPFHIKGANTPLADVVADMQSLSNSSTTTSSSSSSSSSMMTSTSSSKSSAPTPHASNSTMTTTTNSSVRAAYLSSHSNTTMSTSHTPAAASLSTVTSTSVVNAAATPSANSPAAAGAAAASSGSGRTTSAAVGPKLLSAVTWMVLVGLMGLGAVL